MRQRLFTACLALLTVAGATATEDFNSTEWKQEIARGYLPYRKLTYDDFPLADGAATAHGMHTEGFLHYSYKAKWAENDDDSVTARVCEMTIRSGLDQNKSWRRSALTETRALLEHEQGHLDIMELCAADFRETKWPHGTGATAQAALDDLKEKIDARCDKYRETAQAEQDKYDGDTNHGSVPAAQQEWTNALRKRLDDRHLTYWNSP